MRENHRGSTNGRIRHQEAGYMSATQMFSMHDLILQWCEIPSMSLHYRSRTRLEHLPNRSYEVAAQRMHPPAYNRNRLKVQVSDIIEEN